MRKILSICSPRGLLVGGQALAFWADHLQVERPVNLKRASPIDVLDSRIQNLHLLPEKRTDAGIAQARLEAGGSINRNPPNPPTASSWAMNDESAGSVRFCCRMRRAS